MRMTCPLGQTGYTKAMKRGLALLLLILSIVFLGASISCFIDAAQGRDVSNSIGGGFVLLAFALGSGIGALRGLGSLGAKPGLSQDEKEHLVLATASSSGGKLTVAELALESGLPVDEAQDQHGQADQQRGAQQKPAANPPAEQPLAEAQQRGFVEV